MVLAAQIGVRVAISPSVLSFADRSRERAYVLLALAWMATAAAVAFSIAEGFSAILLVALLLAAIWGSVIPLTDAVAIAGVRRRLADYGRTRLWGSVAFIFSNVAGGVIIGHYGIAWFPALLFLAFLAAALMTCLVPRIGRTAAITAHQPRVIGLRRLWPRGDIAHLLPALLAVALIQSSHALFYGFGSILWTERGYSAVEVGILWAIGVVAEIFLFRYASRIVKIIGARRFLMLGGAMGVVRWCLFPVDLGLFGYAILQIAHGFTFGATHLSLQNLIGSNVSEHRIGAAQGTAFALHTTMMAGATFGSGAAYAALGANAFFVMAGLAAGGLALTVLAPRAFAPSAP